MTTIYNNPEYENPAVKSAPFDEAVHNAAMIAKFDSRNGALAIGGRSAQADARKGDVVHRGQNAVYVSRDGQGSDILGSARAQHGSAVLGDLKADHLVTVDGLQMTIGAAIQAGILARDAAGNVVDPNASGKR